MTILRRSMRTAAVPASKYVEFSRPDSAFNDAGTLYSPVWQAE